MYQDITRFGISAFGRIKRLACRLLDRHASAAICAAPTLPAARVTMTELGPQLDAAVIGRHCRQVFPAAPVDGVFDDLLARLEACEWRDSGAPLSASAPDNALACVG